MTNLIEEIAGISVEMPPLETETARQEVTRILDRLVTEKGRDYVYPYAGQGGNDCMYVERIGDNPSDVFPEENNYYPVPVEELAPSCIVGHLLVKAGMTVSDVLTMGNTDAWETLWTNYGFLIPNDWAEDEELMQALSWLQNDQDTTVPWGVAVDRFKFTLENGVTRETRDAAIAQFRYDGQDDAA